MTPGWPTTRQFVHHGLRWFVRLRLPFALLYVSGFGIFQLYQHYKLDSLCKLPAALSQSASDTLDETFGKNYLDLKADELKAKADGGNGFAQYVYARRHTTRVHSECIIKVDDVIAQTYMKKAAELGISRANAVLALWYQRGNFSKENKASPADLVTAQAYAEKAAQSNDGLGLRILADLEFKAADTEPDLAARPKLIQTAARHLIQATERGNYSAHRILGDKLVEGYHGLLNADGEPVLVQNYEQALSHYQTAARGRDLEASVKLAKAYEDGLIAPKNLPQAYAWYLVAAQLAKPKAKTRASTTVGLFLDLESLRLKLAELSAQMDTAQRVAGQNKAAEALRLMPNEREATLQSVLESR